MAKRTLDPANSEPTASQIEYAAEMAHEANRNYCESIGDTSIRPWGETPEDIRNSARDGVRFIWDGSSTSEQSHENWFKFKEADGWHYGPVKDAERKTHPAMLPYSALPEEQRVKDYIFRSVVLSVRDNWGHLIP